jgi:hypothetical protein
MVVSLLTLCPPAAVYVWADNIPSPKGEHGALRTPHFLLRVTPSHSVVPSGHVTIPAWSPGIAKWRPIGRVLDPLRRRGRSYSGSAETRGHSPLPCGIGATPTSRGFTLTWANPLESLGGRVIVKCRDTQPNTSGRLRTQSAGVIVNAVTQRSFRVPPTHGLLV